MKVAQSCPTLCDPMDCSSPGSSVHGILQARILEWVAIPSPGDLLNPGIEPRSLTLPADSLSSKPAKSPLTYSSYYHKGFPGGSGVKASAHNAGDLGSIPGSGRSPGDGNGNPLQYSCLENPMDGGAWWATVHGVTKSWTRLSNFTYYHKFLSSECSARMEEKALPPYQELSLDYLPYFLLHA